MGNAVILNAGPGSWAFEPVAEELSRVFEVPVSDAPARFNYVLAWDSKDLPGESFIPFSAITTAIDKRTMARAFEVGKVPTPRTLLLGSWEEVREVVGGGAEGSWVLKWPTGCGAAGHQVLATDSVIPGDWPRPFVVQEFVPLERPEVYRLYGVQGDYFGWNARRFGPDVEPSPWVAHVRGARYELAGEPPPEAIRATELALKATGLSESFGCADLLLAPDGEWVVLEVNTDGPFMHVDRDVPFGISELVNRKIGAAFRAWSEK